MQSIIRSRVTLLLTLPLFLLISAPAHAWQAATPPGTTLNGVAAAPDGGVVIAGSRVAGAYVGYPYAARFDAKGKPVWESDAAAMLPGSCVAVAVAADGTVLLAGTDGQPGQGALPAVTALDPRTGSVTWHAELPWQGPGAGTDGQAAAIALTTGGVLVGGYLQGQEGATGFVACLDSRTGAEKWRWLGGGMVRALATDTRGNVFATGTSLLAARISLKSGSELFRIDRSRAKSQPLGYPQMRTLTLDRHGNLTVGGCLRDTENDVRSFYVARVSGATGAINWEYAGSPLPDFEEPSRVVADASGEVYAGGRLRGVPAVLRVSGAAGLLRWARQPWTADGEPDRSLGVTDVALDSRSVYSCGSDAGGRFSAAAFSHTGTTRWTVDFGEGSGIAAALAPGGRLYLIGNLFSADQQSTSVVVIGIRASDRKSL